MTDTVWPMSTAPQDREGEARTVLLTGGAGFIGRHVHPALSAAGHRVRVLDSMRPDVHGQDAVAPDGVVVADIRDGAAVEDALRGVDTVVHLAAKVGLGVDVQDLPDYADSNDHGTAVLLAAMARARVRRLVLAGSMVVYGEGLGRCPQHGRVRPGPRTPASLAAREYEPPCPICGQRLEAALVDEDTPPDPRNGYAASKIAQEHWAGAWALATGGSLASLRLHNVYGPGMPQDTPYAGVAAIFASALRADRPPQVFEDGGQRRDFVHVDDVAEAFVAALGHREGVRAYNVGSGTPHTVGDLAHQLATALGGPGPVVSHRFRLGDVRHITADSTRVRAELGWSPQVGFAAGIADLAHALG